MTALDVSDQIHAGETNAPTARKRILVVANLTSSLKNFRYDILNELAQRAEVLAVAPDDDPAIVAELKTIGVRFQRIPMKRAGISPIADLVTLAALIRICRDFRPDILFPYTMKPIIYGSLAGRLTGVPNRVPMCTGLGYVFFNPDIDMGKRLLRQISVLLYKVSLKGVSKALVYNKGDAQAFRHFGLVAPSVPLVRVPGSGINLKCFPHVAPPKGELVFLMVARLLRMKGVPEYVDAARKLKRRFPRARCQLLGPFDDNPSSLRPEQLQEYIDEGSIEYLGQVKDVRPILARCSVFVLPSYCEGISRSVLEAMSTGRAVVTSDGIGCAEPVIEGQTGFVVPTGNADALADAMARFCESPHLISEMGNAARSHAEATYDVFHVNQHLLRALDLANHPMFAWAG